MKKSKCLLISWIIGAAYMIYLVSYMAGAGANAGSSAEAVGVGLATALVAPHALCVLVAVVLNIIGWAKSSRGLALAGAILYAVSMILMPIYFMFVIVEMILSFVGFANLKKLANGNK